MSQDLEVLQASLKRLLASKESDREAYNRALVVAMQGVQAALTELIAANERAEEADPKAGGASDDAIRQATDRIVNAIRGVKLDAPEMPAPVVKVAPAQVTVAAPSVTVAAAPPAVNHVTVQAPAERPRAIRYDIDTELNRFGQPTGKMSITPIYA